MSNRDAFDEVRRIADAVLYEGYVLYPYRASSRKNRYRWTFGVIAPRAWSEAGGCEPAAATLECLVAIDAAALSSASAPLIEGRLRFLQVERRTVEAREPDGSFRAVESLEVDGQPQLTWEDGVERELPFAFAGAPGEERLLDVELPGRAEEEGLCEGERVVGRVVRTQQPLALRLTAETAPIGAGLLKLILRIENKSPIDDPRAPREEAVTSALVGAHLILALRAGGFVSLLDPPPEARAAADACHNEGLFPVLAGAPGTRTLLLASPIVLYDYPLIALESPGDSFDGTEIDELLTLSTRSLTDEEKREARATCARAAEVVARADGLCDAALMKLHGKTTRPQLGRGCRVRVRLRASTGAQRTDAQDMFLDGRLGVVEEVREDFDGQTHVAIVLDDDPGADLHRWYGRHLHFRPDELELVEAAP